MPAQAQILGKIKRKVDERVATKTDEAIDKGLDKAENAVKCAATDEACVRKAKESGKTVTVVDDKGKELPEQTAAVNSQTASKDAPGKGVWLNYDFVPGDRTIWFNDFTEDDVGDFPRRLKLQGGNFEVVEIKGKKYLRTTTGGSVRIELPEKLPDRFTVEAHYFGPTSGNPLRFMPTDRSTAWGCYQSSGFVHAADGTSSEMAVEGIPETDFVDCRFTVDVRYIKAYVNTTRVANHPTSDVERTNEMIIALPSFDQGTLLTDIRIAAGGKKLYDLLSEKGRVATQGILFDFASDRIRGESTPTLKEIGDMLTQHPDLKLSIEGHTDNVGSAPANQALSEKRAAAVRQYLVDNFKIDGSRLQSAGFGASKPAASNDTPEGRQNNRRVELVKL